MTKKKKKETRNFSFPTDRPPPTGSHSVIIVIIIIIVVKERGITESFFFPSVGVVVEISQTIRDKSVATFSTLFGRVNSLLLHYTRLSGNLLPPALHFKLRRLFLFQLPSRTCKKQRKTKN